MFVRRLQGLDFRIERMRFVGLRHHGKGSGSEAESIDVEDEAPGDRGSQRGTKASRWSTFNLNWHCFAVENGKTVPILFLARGRLSAHPKLCWSLKRSICVWSCWMLMSCK